MIAVVALLLAAQAGDAPPAPSEEALPPAVEEPAPAEPEARPDDSDDDDDGERPRLRPPPDMNDGDKDDDDDDDGDDDGNPFASVLWGGATGCAVGGALPLAGSAIGLSLFYGGSACGDVAGVVGGVSGALIGIPSLLLLGPCAAGGAACGAAMGAILSAQDPLTALFWSLPGIGLGLASGVIASIGVLVSSSSDTSLGGAAVPLGTTLVIIGGAGALVAGPLAVAGATFTQEPWEDMLGDLDGTRAPPLRDGGVEAKAQPTKKKQKTKTTTATWAPSSSLSSSSMAY